MWHWQYCPGRETPENVDRNREIFGGDLIGASHLWAGWYSCGFT